MLTFCFIIGSLIVGLNSLQEYYFVVAPNVIRFEHHETVIVSIFGPQTNVAVSVWLEHRGKHISEKNITVPNKENPVRTTVKVNESAVFGTVAAGKPRNIELCSRRGSDGAICRTVVLSYKTGYLIVQTDKPIYTPLQKVKIRVLTLDESLKVVRDEKRQVAMDIVSPSNLTLGRQSFATNENRGFYTKVFKLPPFPEIGIWTARAFYKGQYETVSRSLFQVEEYVLPTFGVTIDVSEPYILQSFDLERSILITVKAEYVYGKPVDGTARLSLNITNNMGVNNYLLDMARSSLQNGVKEFSIKVGELLDAKALRNRAFPDGHRLLVVATVLESATGKEEAVSHEGTVLAAQPYQFKFTRCKKYFRTGMEYYVQIDMQTANELPAVGKNITVQKLNRRGLSLEAKPAQTNNKGHALAIFSVQGRETLKFKVVGPGGKQESDILEVMPYEDENQIQVELITTTDNIMLMQATTNMKRDGPSNAGPDNAGMMFVLVSRGKVEHAVFKPGINRATETVSDELQQRLNPSARLLVFYVDEGSNKVVADSIKFDVEAKCRGRGLTLEPDRREYVPGQPGKLTITGNSNSWVGLNAMDKALLLLNDENILKKSKMFDALRSHDLGCGEGGGRNNGDVFKNTGLTILTNANVEDDINKRSEGCDRKKRRKRHLSHDGNDVCYGADIECCNHGYVYAEILFYEMDEQEMAKIDPYVKCYAKARNMTLKEGLSTQCIMAFFLECQQELESFIYEEINIISKSLDDISSYESDLKRLAQEKVKPYKRTDFRESILFDEVQLSAKGIAEKQYDYPDSITEWMIQAIGISEDKGVCIADPVDVKVFREFFIQLDLPYKATRLELFDVKATLFNYGSEGDPKKAVNMYLEGSEGLCYNNEAGQPSPKQSFMIGPNSAQTVRFPMVPVKDGLFSVIVIAVVTNLGIPQVDKIEKKLLVVNEGIQETITFQVCLDPNEQKQDCESTKGKVNTLYGNAADTGTREQVSKVDLTLPKIAIPGTGSATAYVQGNIMDNVVKTILHGAESLFRMPTGCGEQVIAAMAPNVYAMMYLRQTNQVTASAEVTGSSNIRHGVDVEKSEHRHDDGSYSIYKFVATSTWLTAFVAKVFCHAKKVVDDAVDEADDLNPTIVWLNNRIDYQGQFKEIRQVNAKYMMGQTKVGSPGFTAFVLIALLECNVLPDTIKRTVDLATKYIEDLEESWLKRHPYDLAICTYALALTKSNRKDDFKKWLHSIERKNGENIYWGNSNSVPADAYTVETTAYALLAMLQFNDLKTSAHIVRWLTSQQNARGTFKSTQDTNVALQGLSEYSIRTFSADLDLKVTMIADGWKGTQLPLKNDRFQLQQTVKNLPVEKGSNTITMKVTGTAGSGRMRIDIRYNRNATDDEICPFEISTINISDVSNYPIDKNIGKLRECDVCGTCSKDPVTEDLNALTTTESNTVADSNFGRRKRQAEGSLTEDTKCVRFSVRAKDGLEHGMSMIYFNLETDVTVKQEDLKKLVKENDNLDEYEMPTNGKGFIVFYLSTLTFDVNNFIFRLVDNFKGDKNIRQPASVDVFDYYNPDKYCRKIYGTGPNKEVSVDYTCAADKSQCKCLQSMCSQSVENEIIEMINDRNKKPAVKLFRYTCNAEKANYAAVVGVTKIRDYNNSTYTVADASVIRSINQGIIKLEPREEIIFYWQTSCSHPKLKVGTQYYIIAKDGHDVEINDDEKEYRYPLMGTALVIEVPKPRKTRLRRVMKTYEKLMKDNGCLQ